MAGPNLPSSFASAAAGQNSGRDRASGGRGESRGSASGDWLRRDGRSNGTAILRRSSTTPFNNQTTTLPATENSLAGAVNDPPASNSSAFFAAPDAASSKYTKEDLLQLGKLADSRHVDVDALMMAGFSPGGQVNGNAPRGWGKPNDAHAHNDPTVCWDPNGDLGPLGHQEMSSEEKELYASDVNSPLKQQQQSQQQNKEGVQGGAPNGRKLSMSHSVASPSGVPRPATRRRETTDTNPFSGGGGLISPIAVGPGRFDSPWLGRKGFDPKENEAPDEEPKPSAQPPAKPAGFAGLARSQTSGAAGFPTVWGASAATTPVTAGFSGFGNFALATPGVADKGFASSGGSRFFKKDENPAPDNAGTGTGGTQPWRSRPRTDTDPFGGQEGLSGSAALGGARDTSPPPMPTAGSQIFDTPAKGNASDFGMSGLSLGGSRGENASSASPSQTNPYRSPLADRGDNERDDVAYDKAHALGAQSEQNSNFGSIRGYPTAAFDGSDRSQTSSVGAKNYPSLGNIGGWPTAGGFPTATPDRERSAFGGAFGSSVFSPIGGDLQSPSLGNIGGLFGPASTGLTGSGSLRGSSKIQSLFPPAMQAQMQNQETESLADSIPDLRQGNPLGVIGGGTIGSQRDTDSPLPSMGQRSIMDLFTSSQSVSTPGLFTAAEHGQPLATAPQNHSFAASTQAPPFTPDQPATGPPQSQARTMVMPDRMRWVYMDPQGQQQGPFTGLEMNEWYKANYFTQDLRVRKVEDPDFEPLGQLIRRIGNSREPFLVPQVGIPHGPAPQSGPFSPGGDTRGVIPPLLGVVPSYGKTLTAEEQNNLERRKQEEQLAMARQRELMAQQSHFRNIHPAIPGGLQHQASLHSLQSQPSFGSMTSPIGMPPQPPIGAAMGTPTSGFFEQQPKGAAGLPNALSTGPDRLRTDLNEQERQMLASLHGPGGVSGMFPPQPVGAPSADLRGQLPSVDQLERDPEGFKDRLKEFQEYQGIPTQRADEEAQPGPSQGGPAKGQADDAAVTNRAEAARVIKEVIQETAQPQAGQKKAEPQQPQGLSLTEQVQKAQADAAQAAQRKAEEHDAWAKQSASTGLPMPFPPPAPSSNTPLAAPTAQRRTNIADQYVETRSRTQSPDSAAAAPPPLAPWAREPGTDSHRGPSLREIQEAEAKKAAKLEAERRAALEKEAALAKEREKVNPVLPGLPTTSTWGSGSPAPSASASSPWSKPGVVKAAATPVTPSGGERKKTLAEIQREEEALARKQKAAKEQAAQSAAVVGVSTLGKRYAELASKSGPPGIATATAAAANATPVTASGWATVGAGGKVKVPTGPAAQARPLSASNNRAPASPAAKPVAKPAAPPVNKVSSTSEAQAEFQKWVKSELAKGLNPGTPAEDVATFLNSMSPPDSQLIRDIIYGASSTMDPLRFSEEFIRRKRQADKGIFEPLPGENKAGAGSGGWSEVAKKGGPSTQQVKEAEIPGAAGFKVVPGRKKGKK
ncbi:kinesin-like protein [Cytospora paraplurivora]|uniref:Kinesin-like protein n=1 Tax=Cytospora paraplurivora TaxID=2898453 RepID=A0AAN9U959_9PEZI